MPSVLLSSGPLSCDVGGYKHLSCGRGVRSTWSDLTAHKRENVFQYFSRGLAHSECLPQSERPLSYWLSPLANKLLSQYPLFSHFLIDQVFIELCVSDHAHVG